MAFPEGFSDISDTKKPPFGNEALTQGLLSYQNPKNNADSQWEKLVKSVAFRAEKERKELEETFPQEIRDTVMAIRRQYAYQEYFLDGKPASFDSLEAVWDPITKQISRSFIHLKQGDEKYNLPVLIDTDGDLSLNIQR